MFFNILADATDENAELAAQAVNNAIDAAFNASENIILSGGQGAATLLRGGSTSAHHSDRELIEEQLDEDEDDGQSSVAGAFEYGVYKKLHTEFDPSRLFIWYNARSVSTIPNAVRMNVDVGLKDALHSLKANSHGVCSEQDWSYEVAEYNKKSCYFVPGAKAAKLPPKTVGKLALKHTANYYSVCHSNQKSLLSDLLKCFNEKYPFVFLMKTYNLRNKLEGPDFKLKLPTREDKANGEHTHSLMAVGCNKEEKVFIVRNSWGSDWGDQGHFKMPFTYLPHCYEFWTMRIVASS
ncbi:hypothetical protein COCC4DRAFT_131913 [Bipolaris maydis ATCC 48331]|uniref:Peptidase C1A papain C-terminal domain-containing protein n=2 Tax=Cochliobolus heterostrophus TaxID=5016 RepID=M2U6X3_COCH5|nr:uncharacterized protein COCC4DRAFT_131913 [Bipolaris maydis ATCC 48331]EMD94254.1 hypothetical protein COCHEDRAFT_1028178 [Bipolaris maydis C5]ENI07448.1 hypothetical protein COCC4DRAFT_131913 [Bipolaris maydis ATCC 48331]KAJ6209698.1 hypothetical protein PSV09DRAFT_1028178 [Bipolaris maydis]